MRNRARELAEFVVNKALNDVYTSVPAVVKSYDDDTQTASITLMVNDGEDLEPVIVNCPVQHPGDEYCVAFAIKEGCEGMAMFSKRDLVEWIESGEQTTPESNRQFSINDAWFVPGLRSNPKALKNPPSEGVQLRNHEGDEYIWLKPGKAVFSVPVEFEKGFDAKEKATLDGKNLTKVTHTHPFINADGVSSETQKAKEND